MTDAVLSPADLSEEVFNATVRLTAFAKATAVKKADTTYDNGPSSSDQQVHRLRNKPVTRPLYRVDARRRRIEAMIKKLLCATLALGSVGSLLAADAFTGSWKLDVAKSTFASDNPAPKELTLTFTEQGANRTQTLNGIAADGSATSTAWTAPITGGPVNFPAGQGPNGGASVKAVDDTTLLMTQNHPNGKGASRTYQVSADGKTLTLTQKREDGQERARMVFGRQ